MTDTDVSTAKHLHNLEDAKVGDVLIAKNGHKWLITGIRDNGYIIGKRWIMSTQKWSGQEYVLQITTW
jgi:hypothetical protein